MNPDWSSLGSAALVILTILGGLKWLAVQWEKQRAENREQQKSLIDAMSSQQQGCERRYDDLVDRLRTLEDRQHSESVRILRDAVDALRMNAEAFKRWTEAESPSGRHAARQG